MKISHKLFIASLLCFNLNTFAISCPNNISLDNETVSITIANNKPVSLKFEETSNGVYKTTVLGEADGTEPIFSSHSKAYFIQEYFSETDTIRCHLEFLNTSSNDKEQAEVISVEGNVINLGEDYGSPTDSIGELRVLK